MARRHIKSDFAPDVYVFPGGKVDSRDGVDGDHLLAGPAPRLADRGLPDVGWQSILMAAIRELFEESGLLFARDVNGAWVTTDTRMARSLEAYRDAVRQGAVSMRDLAYGEKLTYAGDHLSLFSNWVTPEVLTRRFDTFFFLARLADGAEARLADEMELTDSLWIRPADALERFRQGDFPLVFATERHLMALAEYSSMNALWEASTSSIIHPVSPRWHMSESERVFFIPGDEGYESARIR